MIISILLSLIIINLVLFYLSKFFSKSLRLIDNPDYKRKIHDKPISKAGGFIFFINFLLINNIYFYNTPHANFAIFLNLFLFPFFLLYFLDDIFDLNVAIKTSLFCLLIIVFFYFNEAYFLTNIYFGLIDKKINFYEFSLIVNILCFYLLVNSFNMTDGVNGLAILIYASWIFLSLCIIKDNFIKDYLLLTLPFVFIFLIYNLKNKIFLGNIGAHILPLFLGTIIIYSNNIQISGLDHKIIKSEIFFLIFLVPGLDLVRLFFFRIFIKKKSFYLADKSHLHHYLLENIGLFKTNLTITILILVPNLFVIYDYDLILPSLFFTLIIYIFLINRNNKLKS